MPIESIILGCRQMYETFRFENGAVLERNKEDDVSWMYYAFYPPGEYDIEDLDGCHLGIHTRSWAQKDTEEMMDFIEYSVEGPDGEWTRLWDWVYG